MVTYGFYNSVDHDRTYDATQVSELFDGLINPGVYSSIGQRFKVEAVGNSFQVSVGTGRAWFNHTWTKNDAPLVLNLPAPPTMADRYRSDAIVIDINSDIKVRENKITYVCGEESANPNPPNPTLASGTHTQIPLAYVRRGAENAVETSINQSQINYVVGTVPECPWVVGVLQSTDISLYVQRWEDAWDTWFAGKQEAITTDVNDVHTAKTNAIDSINTAKTNAIDSITTDENAFKARVGELVSEFRYWMSDKKDEFDDWFANIRYILDGDVAGHLQIEIEDLADRVTPIENGGTGNPHGYIRTGFKKTGTYQLGEFSTAEGMNTVASGKSSHAEGSGEYSYTYNEARMDGDRLWDGEPYLTTENPIPQRLSNLNNVTGKIGGTEVLSLTMKNNNSGSSTLTGRFSNAYPVAWALFYVDTKYSSDNLSLFKCGEIDSSAINLSISIPGDPSGIDISFSGTSPNGNYTCTYSIWGDPDYYDYTYVLKFYNSTYNNDVKASFSSKRGIDAINALPQINKDPAINVDAHTESINSLYVAAMLINETTGEVLHQEVGCIGVYNTSEKNYIGHYGNVDYKYTGRKNTKIKNIIDIGMFSSMYGEDFDPNDPYKYDPDHGYTGDDIVPVLIRPSANESEAYWTYVQTKYWYIDGDTPEDSTILVRQLPCFAIGTGRDGSAPYFISFEMLSNYFQSGGTIYDPKRSDSLIIKAGNTNTYSLKIYYSPTYESDVTTHKIIWYPAGEQLIIGGSPNIAYGDNSHAEGRSTYAKGDYSHAEGYGWSTNKNRDDGPGAFGRASHVEGYQTKARGAEAHAEGMETYAFGNDSHAEGYGTISYGDNSHAEGMYTEANGYVSHSEGSNTKADGNYSHAGGFHVIAHDNGQFVHGFISDTTDTDKKLICSNVFGIPGEPRWTLSSYDETNFFQLDKIEEKANKNKNGFSIILKCPTSVNGIYYKALLPNNIFATYMECIELIAGTPTNGSLGVSNRIIRLSPNGSSNCRIDAIASLCDVHSGANSIRDAVPMPVSASTINISTSSYKYPVIQIKNTNSDMVSNSTRAVYLKYTLIRLV